MCIILYLNFKKLTNEVFKMRVFIEGFKQLLNNKIIILPSFSNFLPSFLEFNSNLIVPQVYFFVCLEAVIFENCL